jgi:hypothetical protein
MSTFRLVSFAAALVANLAWASTGLAFEDPPPKDEALEGLIESLEKAEKGEPGKSAGKAEEPASAKESAPKAAEPKDKGEVAPKDQALDSLLEKLGETTETPAPVDKPAGKPQPSDEPAPPGPDKPAGPEPDQLEGVDKSLDERLEELTGRRRKKDKDQEQEGEGSGPLAQVIKEMRDVEQRLQEPDTGEETRKKQAEIVKNLDTIIEQLRSTSGSSKGKSLRMVRQAGQKPGSQPGTDPGSNGGQAPNAMPAKPSGKQALAGSGKDEWGHLPEELRQEMANVFKEEYLTSKFDLIRRYYLSVSQKSLVREE